MKTCIDCGETKPEVDFQERKKGTGKRQAHCKSCGSARSAAWNAAHPERLKASQRRYPTRNPGAHAAAQARYRKRTYVPSDGFVALSARTHILYRLYDADDELLYVGITVDPKTRLRHHREQKPWWAEVERITQEEYPNRESALTAETSSVRQENPRYNLRKRGPRVS